MYAWKKQIHILEPLFLHPLPYSNDVNVTPHLLLFTGNVKVEDMISKNTIPKGNTEKQKQHKPSQGRNH